MASRIESFELAFRMQAETPKLVDLSGRRDTVVGAHTQTVLMMRTMTKRGQKRNAKAEDSKWNSRPPFRRRESSRRLFDHFAEREQRLLVERAADQLQAKG